MKIKDKNSKEREKLLKKARQSLKLKNEERYKKEIENLKPIKEDIAYICGAIHGDGFFCKLYTGRHVFGLSVIDLDFIEEFRKCLKNINIFCRIYNRKDGRYSIIITKKSYNDFLNRYIPLKSKNLNVPRFVKESKNKKIIGSYLKGMYDSEGCVYIQTNSCNRGIFYIKIDLYSNDISFLNQIKLLMKKIFLEAKINKLKRNGNVSYHKTKGAIRTKKDVYDLFIPGRLTEIFNKYVGFSIKRKQNKVIQFLKNKKYKYKPYSKEEDNFILNNYSNLTDKEIGETVGRSVIGIQMRRLKLGTKKLKRIYWTEEQTKILKENYGKINNKELSIMIGKPVTCLVTQNCRMKKNKF